VATSCRPSQGDRPHRAKDVTRIGVPAPLPSGGVGLGL
jgi:hypothetical protein